MGMPLFEILSRLIAAAFLCGAIGFEREYRHKPAGLRTNMLVGIGTAIVCLVTIELLRMFPTAIIDPAHLASMVMSGIGFLGAGTILHERGSVSGLTTAASLWLAASIGLAAGMGLFTIAVCGTVLGLITLAIVGRFHLERE